MIAPGDAIASGRGVRVIRSVERRPDLGAPGRAVYAVLFEDSEPHDAPSLWSDRREWEIVARAQDVA